MNLREALQAASRPAPKRVVIEGIDAEVFVRVLTVGEILEQQEDVKDGDNRPSAARALARVLVDELNVRVYDPREPADIEAILALPWMYVRRIIEQANLVNGLTVASAEAAKN